MNCKAAIYAVGFLVLWSDVAIDIRTIDMNLAEQLCIIAVFHQGLTQFVRQDESGLVLHTQVTRQLQRRHAFDCIGKYGYRREIDFKRKFVIGEYCA